MSAATGHTPGPWKMAEAGRYNPEIGITTWVVFSTREGESSTATAYGGSAIRIMDEEESTNRSIAIARLIAAAPDYHAAALLVRESSRPLDATTVTISMKAYDAIYDAIAKTEDGG